MAYENVTPPALPSYDTAAYPKYVLVFDYGAKESDWYQVHLYYSATAFTYNGSVATNAGVVFKQVYDDSIGAWADYGELSEAVNLSPGLKDGVYQRIYTNHDILDGEGTVWLAADSVTPVEETGVTEEWLFSFKTGLSLGLCGNALPWKAEPVKYRYKLGPLLSITIKFPEKYSHNNTWEVKTWDGLTSYYASYNWSDGTNIYHLENSNQYVLNGDTWEVKTWDGFTSFNGVYIWSDGTNIYYSYNSNQYVLK